MVDLYLMIQKLDKQIEEAHANHYTATVNRLLEERLELQGWVDQAMLMVMARS